jgi:hypothetical protein
MGCSCRTFRNEPFAKGPQDLRADKKKTPLSAGQVPCSAYVRTARGLGESESRPARLGSNGYGGRGHTDVMAITKSAIRPGDAMFSGMRRTSPRPRPPVSQNELVRGLSTTRI